MQTDESLANPALIDTFHLGLRSNEIAFGEKNRPGDVVIKLGPDKVPPPAATVVTWTFNEEAPYYCVEPWMGPANAPEHKVGLHWVAPGETQRFSVQVNVR